MLLSLSGTNCFCVFSATVAGTIQGQLHTAFKRIAPKSSATAGSDESADEKSYVASGDSGEVVNGQASDIAAATSGAVVSRPSGHVVMTEAGKRYQCNICQKLFKQNRSLIRHSRTHTGERPYTCDICQQRFMQSQISSITDEYTREKSLDAISAIFVRNCLHRSAA